MSKDREKLFGEFTPVSSEEWKNKIIEDLKGADYDKKMIWRTSEGFNVKPFYRKEDIEGVESSMPGEFPYTRGNRADNNWLIRQNIPTDDVEAANADAKRFIEQGGTSIGFSIKGRMVSAEFIAQLLNGIDAEQIELNFAVCAKRTVDFAHL